jgi:hypothetical protein
VLALAHALRFRTGFLFYDLVVWTTRRERMMTPTLTAPSRSGRCGNSLQN